MAKGNLFQGMGRGKVGDVVFTRLNGQQISRVRNRSPRNPKTNAQLYQRAIMATIMRAYGEGKEIFDHSFETLSKGSANQRKFMSENTSLLRSLVASEKDIAPTSLRILDCESKARVCVPGLNNPTGFDGMIVSLGSYQQNLFSFTDAYYDANDDEDVSLSISLPSPISGETCAAYAARCGIIAGDLYTIVGFVHQGNSIIYLNPIAEQSGLLDTGAKVLRNVFFFIRMQVKADFISSTDPVAAKTLGDIFTVTAVNTMLAKTNTLMAKTITSAISAKDIMPADSNDELNGYVGIIRSRVDVDLRSNSTLHRTEYFLREGITPYWLLDVWTSETSVLGDSSLILEGGNF